MRSKEITKGFDEIRQILRENAQEAKQRAQEAEQRAQEAEQRFQRIEQQREKNAQEAEQRAQEAEQRFQRIEQQREKNAQEAEQRFQRIEQQREKNAQEAEQRAQEAEQRFQRIEQQREKNAQEAEQRYQKIEQILEKNAQELQETRQLIEGNAEQIKANAEQMRETDRKIKELTNLFTGQWGKLIEALIKPGSLKLFQDRGINVKKCKTRMAERLNGGRHMEIDILLKNKVEKIAVVIEVKTTLQISDVNDFLKKFDTFLDFFPKYKGYTIHGAVAGVQIDEGVDKYAYRNGLFVLGLGREGLVRMLNDDKFDPRVFNSSE